MGRRAKRISFLGGNAPAFTLMEVMVTFTIAGFILLIIFGVLRLGLSAWERGESIKEEYQRMRIVSQLISRQLKSIVPYKVKTEKAEGDYLAFEGKASSLRFVSSLSIKGNTPSGLVFAQYEFQEEGKGRLLFFEGRVTHRDFMEKGPPEETGVTLFEGMSGIRFEYYQPEDPAKNQEAKWVEEWNAKEAKELPGALRVIFTPRKGPDRAEGPPLVILTSLPSNRQEELRKTPLRVLRPPRSP